MKFAVVLIIAIVLGLIFRAVSGSQQQIGPWKEWFKKFKWEYLGWGFFGLILFDVYRKIFGSLPVEWKEWVPSFSWNTFESLVLVVGVVILWAKWKKQTNAAGGGTGTSGTFGTTGNNSPAPKRTPAEEKHTAGKVLLFAVFLAVGLGMAVLPKPHQDMIPIPTDGKLYIPLYGLIFMAVWAAFIDLFWSVFDDVDDYALYFVIPLFLGLIILGIGLHYDTFVPIHIDPNIAFAPFTNDMLLDTGVALGAAFAVFLVVFFGTDRDETKVIAMIVLITIWLVQYPIFRSMMHAVFG